MKTNQRHKIDKKIIGGSGNVFADMGFSEADSAALQVKAELTRQIYHRIKDLGLTQTQAGARLGISQPDVSKLMNARFTGYSTERLMALLNALDVDIDIILRPHKRARRDSAGTLRVRRSSHAA